MSYSYNFVVSALIDSSLRCVAVGIVAWMSMGLISKMVTNIASIHLRHRIWTLVLISMLAMPAYGLLLPKWSLPLSSIVRGLQQRALVYRGASLVADEDRNPASARSVNQAVNQSDIEQSVDVDVLEWNDADFEYDLFGGTSTGGYLPTDKSEKRTAAVVSPSDEFGQSSYWTLAAFLIWVVGTCLLALRLFLGLVVIWRIVARARSVQLQLSGPADVTPIPIKVMESGDIRTPVVTGILRPSILLPTGWQSWSPGKLSSVLAHESAHVRRRDLIVECLAEIAVAIYWFHPQAWYVRHQLSRLAELACDEEAAMTTGDRLTYAAHLIEIAALNLASGRSVKIGIAMARGNQIVHRVTALVSRSTPLGTRVSRFALASIIALAVPTIIAIAAAKPSDPQQTTTAQSNGPQSVNNPQLVDDWLIEKSGQVSLLIHGQVVMPDGSPVQECEINIAQEPWERSRLKLDGSKFQLDVPYNQRWIILRARTKDGQFQSSKWWLAGELLAFAKLGLTFKLQPTRPVQVNVTDENGLPIKGAIVKVACIMRGSEHSVITGPDGIARCLVPVNEDVAHIVVRTEDSRVGGRRVERSERLRASFDVQLLSCKPKTVRVVDDSNAPIPNLKVKLTAFEKKSGLVVESDPAYFVTNGQGEFTCNWFPDLPAADARIEFDNSQWYRISSRTDRSVKVLQLGRLEERIVVTGSVAAVDGFDLTGMVVNAHSFEHEEEYMTDDLVARVDRNGNYSLAVRAGATYAISIEHPELVVQPWHQILVARDKTVGELPVIEVRKGIPVSVRVTEEESERPVSDQFVRLIYEHEFAWFENNRVQRGSAGVYSSGRTDLNGNLRVFALPGKYRVQASTSDWNYQEPASVLEGQENSLHIRRPTKEFHNFQGQLILTNGAQAELANAPIIVQAATEGRFFSARTKSDADGRFEIAVAVSRLEVYAATTDGKAAGLSNVEISDKPIQLFLSPTGTYRAQVMDEEDKPIVGRQVSLSGREQEIYKQDGEYIQIEALSIEPFVGTTNGMGFIEISGVPLDVPLQLQVKGTGDERSQVFGKRILQLRERRPTELIRLQPPNSAKPSKSAIKIPMDLELRLRTLLLNCKLNDANALIVISNGDVQSEQLTTWVLDTEKVADVVSFLPLVVTKTELLKNFRQSPKSEPLRSLAFQNFVKNSKVTLVVLEKNAFDEMAAGMRFEQAVLHVQGDKFENWTSTIKSFIKSHATWQQDALQKWHNALAQAKQTGRRVWVRNSQTRCAPCITFTRWLFDQQSILDKDYVMVKIDNVRDLNVNVMAKLMSADSHGVPFHAIYDADGQKLIDSVGPLGNIGDPSSFEDINHFRRMISETATHITASEIDKLIESLEKREK